MNYNISMSDPWFDLIKIGEKKYEGRRYYYDVPKYKVGDIIKINRVVGKLRTGDNYLVRIINIHKFNTFEEAMNNLPLNYILPGVETIDDGINIYKKFVSIETQERDGVCMIELEVL